MSREPETSKVKERLYIRGTHLTVGVTLVGYLW